MRKLVLIFSHFLTFSPSHPSRGERIRVRGDCREAKWSVAGTFFRGRREWSTFRHRRALCLAARISAIQRSASSVAAIGRLCRSEMSAYITLQVSVVDWQPLQKGLQAHYPVAPVNRLIALARS